MKEHDSEYILREEQQDLLVSPCGTRDDTEVSDSATRKEGATSGDGGRLEELVCTGKEELSFEYIKV